METTALFLPLLLLFSFHYCSSTSFLALFSLRHSPSLLLLVFFHLRRQPSRPLSCSSSSSTSVTVNPMADLLVSKVNKKDARLLVPSVGDHYLRMEPGGRHPEDRDDFCHTFMGFLKS